MKCDELNQVENPIEWGLYYEKSEVDAAIAELKQKLEDAKATAYAESVDAGMRERRLKRALYTACANWCYAAAAKKPDKWGAAGDRCMRRAMMYGRKF